jgi:hypothetical protein
MGNRSKGRNWLEASVTDTVCENVHTCSYNLSHKLLQFKIIHRTYYTPGRIYVKHPEMSHLCWRCRKHKWTLLHMLWSCDKLTPFWHEACFIISFCLGLYIHPSPQLCLLGNVNIGDQYERTFCNRDLIAAKRNQTWQNLEIIFWLP